MILGRLWPRGTELGKWSGREAQQGGNVCILGFSGGTRGKELACQCRRHKRPGFDPWVEKIPWRRVWQPFPVFLPGESHGQRSLAGYSHWVTKSQTWLKRLSMQLVWLIHFVVQQKLTQHCKYIPVIEMLYYTPMIKKTTILKEKESAVMPGKDRTAPPSGHRVRGSHHMGSGSPEHMT